MSVNGFETRRSFFIGGLSVLAAPAVLACAHRRIASRNPRVGFIIGAGYQGLLDAFHGELSRLGYTPGHNIDLVERLTSPNNAEIYANEIAAMDLDLVVASALPFALLVRTANPSMPMVIGTGAGLVCNGFAKTMERPGGNATGMEELPPGLTGKRLELLLAAAPHVRQVGLLSTTPATCGHDIQLADARSAATRLGVTVKPYRATNPEQIRQSLGAILRDGQQGFVNFQGGLSLGNRQMIVDFAAEHRLPAIYQSELFAESGGLMTWAPDQNEQMRIAARMTDRILRGAKPRDLPILYPERYFLTLNRSAARRIGLDFPPAMLAKAYRLIN